MARVLRVEADPDLQDHFYAYLDGYLEFDTPVGFQGQGVYWEAGLQKADGSPTESRPAKTKIPSPPRGRM